jgi:hypothetical protein
MTVVGIADLALSVLLLNHINIQVSRARYAYMRMAVTLAVSGRQVFLGVIYIARVFSRYRFLNVSVPRLPAVYSPASYGRGPRRLNAINVQAPAERWRSV